MTDSQVYRFFLDTPSEPFLFIIRLNPNFRPKVGDSLLNPVTFENFRVMRDEIITILKDEVRVTDDGKLRITDEGVRRITSIPSPIIQGAFRITSDGDRRVTDDGDFRITAGVPIDLSKVTHNYFILPANNPNRISTWTTNRFDDDQTLRQLFR